MEYLVVLSRTLFFYFLVVMIYRLMGKREVGQLGIVDLIISLLIAELVAMGIENFKESIWLSIIPIVLLTVLQIILALVSMKFPKFRTALDGKPSMIVENGKLNFKEMVKQRYNLDDLLSQLREQGIKSIEDVEYAILEANGKLSIFKYNTLKIKSNLPMPLILDGKINYDTLKALDKDDKWLYQILLKNAVSINNVFYAFYKGNKTFIIKKDN